MENNENENFMGISRIFEKMIYKNLLEDDNIEDDNIEHPNHYCGVLPDYECIDMMQLLFGSEQLKSFCKLNAFKYLFRFQNKNGKEDLLKCQWYLNKLNELEKKEEE